MGPTSTSNTKMNIKMTSFVYFAVSLIAIAVSQDQLPGVEQVVPETPLRIAPKAPHPTLLKKVDASFYQKAKAEIAEMMESGKSKKECRDAAKEMKKQVEESVKNDANSKSRYLKICKDEGMVPVGCNEYWKSYDCGGKQGRNNCMSLPQGFSCDAIRFARSVTKFKGNLIGYWTNGDIYSGSYFYTTNGGVPTQDRSFHPLCAKYGTTSSHPKDL